MFQSIGLLLLLIVVFGSLYFVFKFCLKKTHTQNGIGKVIATFPINYKIYGYIIKICDNYYLCCDNCGIIKIDYDESMDNKFESISFQEAVAKEYGKIKNINIDTLMNRFKNNKRKIEDSEKKKEDN